ncbi:MAG: hypothetical protein MUP69_04985 [Candidatus Atribacteria bacterium]|nr:hypothetical protein [Candidatus Atribacteria bacterium]
MNYYNYRRMHQGYKLKQNDFRKPAEAHFSKNLTLNKKRAKVKIPESIRGEKGVEENLPFTHDSIKIENGNKEVLEYQFVTTS